MLVPVKIHVQAIAQAIVWNHVLHHALMIAQEVAIQHVMVAQALAKVVVQGNV